MCNKFNVYLEKQIVGTAEIQINGLYYHICCRCKLPTGKLFRLNAICGQHTVDLGICVPFEDGFGVNKRVPVKNLDTENVLFQLSTKQGASNSIFLPLDPQKPFEKMAYLMDAKFERQNGVAGLLIISS